MRLEDLQLQPKDIARFWSKVDRAPGLGPKGQCWFWHGTLKHKDRGRGGYGVMTTCRNGEKSVYYAHVLSFLMAGGELPEGEQVLHSCDIGRCVYPDDLRAGTQGENMKDLWARRKYVQKGRIVETDVIIKVRRIALARGYQNWRQLQADTGLDEGTVEGLWSNKTIYANIGALGRIAEVLSVEPGDLIGRAT